jgi:hypothetical protein
MRYVIQNGIARTQYELSNSSYNLAAVYNRIYNPLCLVVRLGDTRHNTKKL